MIKQESREDPKVLFLNGGPRKTIRFLLMRNMEEITDCSLEKNEAALDNVPR